MGELNKEQYWHTRRRRSRKKKRWETLDVQGEGKLYKSKIKKFKITALDSDKQQKQVSILSKMES